MIDAGYLVSRVPMPARYCTLYSPQGSCIVTPNQTRTCTQLPATQLDRVWATYANSIRVENKMIVPVYRDVPPSLQARIRAQEAEALGVFQRELDAEFGAGE